MIYLIVYFIQITHTDDFPSPGRAYPASIIKVYIERNNMQVELIFFRTTYCLYSHSLFRSEGFNAISSTEGKYRQWLSDRVYCHWRQ